MTGPTRIVSTFHSSSSVISSVKCKLSAGDLEYLVIAKFNALEVYSLQPEALQRECTLEIWGKVRSIKAIPIANSLRSNILVLLDHPDPELLFLSYTEYGPGTGKLNLKKQLQLDERGARAAEFFNDVLVHPSGRLAVVSCYAGRLKVVTLQGGYFEQQFDVQLPEINLLSLAFLPLPRDDQYTLAILHVDHKEHIQLLCRDLTVDDNTGADLSYESSLLLEPTSIPTRQLPFPDEFSPQLVAVPAIEGAMDENDAFWGGILIVGGRKLILFELSSLESQEKRKGKRKRLESRKKSSDASEATKAAEKEKEREVKKRKPKAIIDWPWSRVTACSLIDSSLLRLFIGDTFGRLALLSLSNLKDHGLVLIPLGETSPPTTITYLTNQAVFIGSHLGDSQVIEISPVPTASMTKPTLPIDPDITTVSPEVLTFSDKGKGKAFDGSDSPDTHGCIIATRGSFVTVLQSFKNIAPISDGIIVDSDGTGQIQIVTCSGGGNTGSVNLVRTGGDFEELALIPGMENMTNVWPISLAHDDKKHSHLIVSTLQNTHVFELDSEDSVTHVDSGHEFATGVPTLSVRNMALKVDGHYGDSSLVVQVTPRAVYLLEFNHAMKQWSKVDEVAANNDTERDTFVAADINPSQILLAKSGGMMVIYAVEGPRGNVKLVLKQNTQSHWDSPNSIYRPWFRTEISAVTCTPLNPLRPYTTLVAAAFWHTNQIKLYTPAHQGFEFLCQTPSLNAPVRSLVLAFMTKNYTLKDKDSHAFLLAGCADGTLVSFELVQNNKMEVKDMKVTSLGRLPVSVTSHEAGDNPMVIATGSRSVLLTWDRSRLHVSPITLKDIVSAQPLHTDGYPESLILATNSGILIGRVKNVEKLHIYSVPLGLDNPRHIVHHAAQSVFGVGCTHTEPNRIGEPEKVTSSFKLLDDVTFQFLTQLDFELHEQIMSLTTLDVPVGDHVQTFFCIGTVHIYDEDIEPTSGRILILEVLKVPNSNTQLSLLASEKVDGCVYSLATVNGLLAAAVNSSVVLYQLDSQVSQSVSSHKLSKVVEWNHNYLVNTITAYDDHLVVADQFSSVSLLKLAEDSKLHTVARDYSPLWPVAVSAFDTKSIIGADQALNLFSFSLGDANGRPLLNRDGFYHVGEVVSKFVRGTVISDNATMDKGLKPTHIFCTLSGRIGVVIDINPRSETLAKDLAILQSKLGLQNRDAVGSVSHARHRAPRNSRGRSDADEAAYGFLDGDLLEHYLTLIDVSPAAVNEMFTPSTTTPAENLISSPEDIKTILEIHQNMH